MRCLRVVLLAWTLVPAVHAQDWSGFRGPTGMGPTADRDLPLKWGPDENVRWQAPLPPTVAGAQADHNQSSPIVVRDRVIVTTAHWPAGVEKKGTLAEHRVSAYAAADGQLIWSVTVKPGAWALSDLRGGYAAPTPVSDGQRVFALFGSAILHALNVDDGSVAWSAVVPDHRNFDVAIASGPVMFKDTVILQADKNGGASTLTAYDAATGAIRWQRRRPDTAFSHATPRLIDVGGKPQLIVSATQALQGVDPNNGQVIWSCDWGRSIWPVSAPVHANGLVFCMGGRGGHPGVVVDPTGSGDVTETHLKWRVPQTSEGMGSPVIVDGRVYRTFNPGVILCVELATGKELFKQRLNVDPRVSPIADPNGRIYFASAGRTVVIRATDKLEVLAENDLGDPCPASAAVSNGRFYLKGAKHLYCVGKR